MTIPSSLHNRPITCRGGTVLLFGLLSLVATSEALAQVDVAPSVPVADVYRIQVGDQLDIKFFYNPTLNEQVIVRPDGRISLQLIQEVAAAGFTPSELTTRLSERYAADLRQPEVTVIVRGFGAQRVFVDGEVARPGLVPILGLTTALQAIAQAGGLKETARDSEVILIRRDERTRVATMLNLRKARDGSDLDQDVHLVPFDIVYVPRSRVANLNLWVDQYIRKNIPILLNMQIGTTRFPGCSASSPELC